MINLKLYPVQKACEIFQSLDIKFAFVNKDMEQVNNPIKCRDFLGDCIWTMKTKKPAHIYGFNYDFKEKPYDLDTVRLSLKFPNENVMECFKKNISLLHEKEKQAKLRKKTKIFETNQENTLVIEANKKWQSSIWKISLYTFYIKLFSYPSLESLGSPENEYFNHLIPAKENVLLSSLNVNEEYVAPDIKSAHNYSGFVSLIEKNKTTQYIFKKES